MYSSMMGVGLWDPITVHNCCGWTRELPSGPKRDKEQLSVVPPSGACRNLRVGCTRNILELSLERVPWATLDCRAY